MPEPRRVKGHGRDERDIPRAGRGGVARIKAILEKIIYSKTLPWQHEAEYRLVIPLGEGEEPWNTLPYHPEEITELYLGLAMSEADKEEIVSATTKLSRDIAIFQVDRDANKKLIFNQI